MKEPGKPKTIKVWSKPMRAGSNEAQPGKPNIKIYES